MFCVNYITLMPLFDVPGWTVPSPLVGDASPRVSKKRKRPASYPSKLQSAELNLDKLVKRLTGNERASSKQAKKSGFSEGSKISDKKRLKKSSPKADGLNAQKTISRPMPLKAAMIERDSVETLQPAKRAKTKHKDTMAVTVQKSPKDSTTSLTALQLDMKQSLDGARFR